MGARNVFPYPGCRLLDRPAPLVVPPDRQYNKGRGNISAAPFHADDGLLFCLNPGSRQNSSKGYYA
ncbi:hypothetical protein LF95_16540 [Thalassospira sp. TSL5-1]|nr:hypothetical protein LF95_16540 [Thalassospira sp. TSL5-1]